MPLICILIRMVRSPCDTHSGYTPNNLVAYHDFRNPDGVTVDQTNVVSFHSAVLMKVTVATTILTLPTFS